MDVLFVRDQTPDATLTALPDVAALFAAFPDVAATVAVPDPAGTLLRMDVAGTLFALVSPVPPSGSACPHMTALMDSANQPIRASDTGLVILVETH